MRSPQALQGAPIKIFDYSKLCVITVRNRAVPLTITYFSLDTIPYKCYNLIAYDSYGIKPYERYSSKPYRKHEIMATPSEKLADSLEALKALQDAGIVAIRSADLGRTHRERLFRAGFLHEVMKGWYIPVRHDQSAGESTAWYTSYWDFCAAYLAHRFGDRWCLSPEHSLALHVGNRAVPQQLLVHTPQGGNKPTSLPHNTSLFDVRYALPDKKNVVVMDGLRLFALPAALVACGATFFEHRATDARAALAMIRDASDILAVLLEGGHSTVAGRLAGAFRNISRKRIADEIIKTMKSAGYDIRESDPFTQKPVLKLPLREPSPYVNRTRIMWNAMREQVMGTFPAAPGLPDDTDTYMKRVEEVYVADAYHSLSIEGYRVSAELIERVRAGNWNPDSNKEDREHRDALAARGYYDTFQSVRQGVEKVLKGDNPGTVAEQDHGDWYRTLWGPSVQAGIITAADLAGYRNGSVYIRRSMHTPPPHEAVRDLMPLLFELMTEETDPAVRVVLGHFIFVYIHPYFDGNGRMGRFLMNAMLAAGGYPWTVIPVERRDDYMAALEAASVEGNIEPSAGFLGGLVKDNMEGKPGPRVPGTQDASEDGSTRQLTR